MRLGSPPRLIRKPLRLPRCSGAPEQGRTIYLLAKDLASSPPKWGSGPCVGGFSDGASYALALCRINGDLFSRVVAFSPGFVPPGRATGKPEIFITHGSDDRILPYESTSGRIAPALKRAGYLVTLRTFAGGHTVPAELAREAFRWAISTANTTR